MTASRDALRPSYWRTSEAFLERCRLRHLPRPRGHCARSALWVTLLETRPTSSRRGPRTRFPDRISGAAAGRGLHARSPDKAEDVFGARRMKCCGARTCVDTWRLTKPCRGSVEWTHSLRIRWRVGDAGDAGVTMHHRKGMADNVCSLCRHWASKNRMTAGQGGDHGACQGRVHQ